MDSMTIQLDAPTLVLAGALLLALVTVESGGWFLTRVVRGRVAANALQASFFRAGHAHAAVLLVLSLANLALLGGVSGLPELWAWIARLGVPIAALLMPAGFFLSVLGREPQKPNRLIALLWVGAGVLTLGLLASGLALIVAGASAA
ncbi:MAG: hypothetical protein J0G30_01185 [Actinomycetales bacterium]|nr:hypothetical protein [Actinomycetales bacterium]